MSKTKGKTMEAPRPSQKELEAKLHQVEDDAIALRWALKKYSARAVLEEFRNDMSSVENFLRVTGDQLWDMAGTNDNSNQQFFLSLGNTLTLYADMMQQKLLETDTCYMDKLLAGKEGHGKAVNHERQTASRS